MTTGTNRVDGLLAVENIWWGKLDEHRGLWYSSIPKPTVKNMLPEIHWSTVWQSHKNAAVIDPEEIHLICRNDEGISRHAVAMFWE